MIRSESRRFFQNEIKVSEKSSMKRKLYVHEFGYLIQQPLQATINNTTRIVESRCMEYLFGLIAKLL